LVLVTDLHADVHIYSPLHERTLPEMLENKIGLTIEEAVALSPFGRSRLYEEIRSGNLAARKIGRRTFILRSDLERFLASLPLVAFSPEAAPPRVAAVRPPSTHSGKSKCQNEDQLKKP
jgi:hypothetical protein